MTQHFLLNVFLFFSGTLFASTGGTYKKWNIHCVQKKEVQNRYSSAVEIFSKYVVYKFTLHSLTYLL